MQVGKESLKKIQCSALTSTLRLGLKNISSTRLSNLLLHFFKILKVLLKSLGAEECLTQKC